MKKLALGLALALFLVLPGCGEKKEETAGSYIAPAVFTAEEQELLRLLGKKENQFFDFQMDESIQSVTFRVYRLEEGAWTLVSDGGGLSGFLENSRQGRMAVLFDTIPDGVEIAMSGSRFGPNPLGEKPAGATAGLMTLDKKREIEGTTEIPLALQIFAENAIRAHDVEDFAHPEELAKENYLAVYAITVEFSTEPLS